MRGILLALSLVATFVAVVAGANFGAIAEASLGTFNDVRLVNEYVLVTVASLFGLRLLIQKTPRIKFGPYLHLPLDRSVFVRFFQGASLVSLHNLFPLAFLVPFWIRSVLPFHHVVGSTFWLAGMLLLLSSTTYVNNAARSLISRYERTMMAVLCLSWIAVAADQISGINLINAVSSHICSRLLTGDFYMLLLLVALFALVLRLSTDLLVADMYTAEFGRSEKWHKYQSLPWAGRSTLLTLLSIELRMMRRNSRPRHYAVISILFSTLYLILLFLNPARIDHVLLCAVVGLFASGGFVLNYGQLMFAWESAFFDGLLTRRIDTSSLVKSKLILLQGSCVLLFLTSLPIFLFMRPDLLALHVAFLLYNAGVTVALILTLAVHNTKRVDMAARDTFFNYQGLSLAHWLWIFPTAIPPTCILFFLRDSPAAALALIGTTGLLGLALTRTIANRLAGRLAQRRYHMAEGFRLQ